MYSTIPLSQANVVGNNVQPAEEPPLSERAKTIGKIALSIIVGMGCFIALPFVGGVGAPIGLALTGLFCITVGVYFMLTGNGLTMFKAWAEERQLEADKEKSKNEQVSVDESSEEQVSVDESSEEQVIYDVEQPNGAQVVNQVNQPIEEPVDPYNDLNSDTESLHSDSTTESEV